MFVNANNIAELIWYLFFLWCLWLYIPPWPEWPLWVGSWKTHDVILTVYSLDCIRTPWLCTTPLTVYCPLDCRVTSCLWPILWPVWVGSGNPHDVILTVKWLHSNYLTTPSPFLRNTSLHPKQGQLNQQVREFWIRVRTDLTKGAGLYQEGLLGLNVS